jgi:hypothetical protein
VLMLFPIVTEAANLPIVLSHNFNLFQITGFLLLEKSLLLV